MTTVVDVIAVVEAQMLVDARLEFGHGVVAEGDVAEGLHLCRRHSLVAFGQEIRPASFHVAVKPPSIM